MNKCQIIPGFLNFKPALSGALVWLSWIRYGSKGGIEIEKHEKKAPAPA
jgi:hypothetical protein